MHQTCSAARVVVIDSGRYLNMEYDGDTHFTSENSPVKRLASLRATPVMKDILDVNLDRVGCREKSLARVGMYASEERIDYVLASHTKSFSPRAEL